MTRASPITLVVLGAAVLLVSLALIWIRDVPLDHQASAWMAETNTQQKPTAGHLYLLGLDAAAEPMSAGQARLAEYRRWRATHSPFDEGFQPAPLSQLDIPKLAAPHDQPGCLEPTRNAAYLTQGRELLARYRQAACLADLRRLIASELAEPWPNFAALVTGNRLLALEACRLLLDGQPGQARALLEEDLGHWRRHHSRR